VVVSGVKVVMVLVVVGSSWIKVLMVSYVGFDWVVLG